MKNVEEVFKQLKKYYPKAHCVLDFLNPFQLLVATILSAQCTDKRVNLVTPILFKDFGTAFKMSQAKQSEIENIIRSTGFFRNKAKNIIAGSKIIVKDFKGQVPVSMSDLTQLPGVARKTANVVLFNAFGINEGIVVDTHVKRIADRLGWTKNSQPEKIEKDLMKLFKRSDWGILSHLLIALGREFCKAPKPLCEKCPIKIMCPYYLKLSRHKKSQ
jgi:endonuclease III